MERLLPNIILLTKGSFFIDILLNLKKYINSDGTENQLVILYFLNNFITVLVSKSSLLFKGINVCPLNNDAKMSNMELSK